MTGEILNLLLVPVAALAGAGAGWLHFASLSRIAAMIVAGRPGAIGLQMGRLVLLVLLLVLFAKGGTAVLLAGAAGIFVGRAVAMRGRAAE